MTKTHDDQLLSRRRVLGMVAKGAAAFTVMPALSSCMGGSHTGPDASGDGGDSGTSACSRIPDETAGPFPGDGTNGQNALTLSGIVRSDIRSSIAGATGVADGVLLTVTLTILDASTCSPLADRAVYVWQCDRQGNYSMYSTAVVDENYLRGVQVTDSAGQVTFTTIFPGCYAGRWPHIHFEVYPSLASATNGSNDIATSQLALPKTACDAVYATSGYSTSATNLSQVSLSSDNVFSDDATLQLATITGSVSDGFVATLPVTVRV